MNLGVGFFAYLCFKNPLFFWLKCFKRHNFCGADLTILLGKSVVFFVCVLLKGLIKYLVFDDSKSYIKGEDGQLNYAIRVSLTFGDSAEGQTKIIGNRSEFNGNFGTKAVEYVDPDTKVGITRGQSSGTFASYSGYDENSNFNLARTLYYLEENKPINVTVRIWLEGGDVLCTDEIAASLLDISLFFDNIAESEVINE